MNTTVESLKNLYVELGGKLTDSYPDIADGAEVGNYTVIPDCIDAVNALVKSGATKELPAATADDAGKVVAVAEDGSYTLGEAGGGLLIVRLIVSGDNDEIWTLDKTYSEIAAALRNTGAIIIREANEYDVQTIWISSASYSDKDGYTVVAIFTFGTGLFHASSADGYPVMNAEQ